MALLTEITDYRRHLAQYQGNVVYYHISIHQIIRIIKGRVFGLKVNSRLLNDIWSYEY